MKDMIPPPTPAALEERLNSPPSLQRGFAWNRSKWGAVVHDLPSASALLDGLPSVVDRDAIREVVQANLDPEHVLGAFVAVYMWGGPTGYGPHRARSVLTGVRSKHNVGAAISDVLADRLIAGAECVQESGHVEAFRLMNNEGRVKYLGGAFFTKWLSFASMIESIDGPDVAPILDARVSKWIAEATSGSSQIRLSPRSTADYRRYLDLLDSWGEPHGRSRVQVELAIFELTRDRPVETD